MLRGGEEGGVKGRRSLEFAHDLLALFENALDAGALFASGLVLQHLEDPLEPLHLMLRFRLMLLERGGELVGLGCFRHFGKGGEDFLFCVVDVLQTVLKKVSQRLLINPASNALWNAARRERVLS
jgi:hypothetical protein